MPYPCSERFVIMGFNHERGVESMLHDYGHRLESTMARAASLWRGPYPDPYTASRRTERTGPGNARCGDTHFPPNADRDYGSAEPTSRSAMLRLAIAFGLERIEEELRQPLLPLDGTHP